MRKKAGTGGHRSRCLMHAKHALYHLSYYPGAKFYLANAKIKKKLEIVEARAGKSSMYYLIPKKEVTGAKFYLKLIIIPI